jgi:hypothetical protein
MTLEERQVFILVAARSMVLFLILDVPAKPGPVIRAQGKRSVTFLPAKIGLPQFLMHPE